MDRAQADRPRYVRRAMLVFPHAKINLGLHVLRLRPDGYRDIATVMLPIPLHDALEAILDVDLPDDELVFVRTGLPVPGNPAQDLCAKAHALLRARHPLPGLRMHLHKAIPIGAGLGGGSSNGAHALRLLNDLLGLGESDADLAAMAAQLGSDCAFFLRNGAQLAAGRGEVLTPLSLDLHGWWLMLINPGVHVSTADVYANTPCVPDAEDLTALLGGSSPDAWTGRLVNVMENYVFRTWPAVAAAKRLIVDAGAVYAAMSGSGSTVFGLFREKPVLPVLPGGYMGWVLGV